MKQTKSDKISDIAYWLKEYGFEMNEEFIHNIHLEIQDQYEKILVRSEQRVQ